MVTKNKVFQNYLHFIRKIAWEKGYKNQQQISWNIMYAADQQTSREMLLNAQVLYVQSNLCMEYYLQISIIWNNNIVEVSTFYYLGCLCSNEILCLLHFLCKRSYMLIKCLLGQHKILRIKLQLSLIRYTHNIQTQLQI